MNIPNSGRLLAASALIAALSACGGGGGGGGSGANPPSPVQPPPAPAPPAPSPPAPAPPAPSPPAPTPPAPSPPSPAPPTAGDTYGLTSTGRVVTFDRASPSVDTAFAITGLQSGETLLGIDVRAGGATPGQLYALGSTGSVYVIDPATGAATVHSTLAADASDTSNPFTSLSGTEFGVDFNPATDRLRVVSDTGQNLRIDVDSGATITDAALAAGVNGAAYTNAFASACRTRLYYINSSTDQLLTTDNPNGGAVTAVGALGVDATAAGDLEITTAADGTNTGHSVLVVAGVPTSYQINLDTGVATSLGAVTALDASELVRDTAIAPPATAPTQSPGDVYALSESNRLISFNEALPQKLCTNVPVSGQQAGENILGIDVRPLDSAVYALGSTGRLYTVDVASGALTLRSTLVAALGDVTGPYTALSGTEFGFDFNPGNDLIRVVSDAGMNFRVTPDDGVVTTDVTPTPAGSVFGAAAYSNSFVSTFTASYYMIDAVTDGLQVMGRTSGNAINGDVQVVGPLGVGDVQSVAGFDIQGDDNQALAALTIGAGTSADLFSINLSTGAATRIETIGGGERLRGLTYAHVPVATVFGLTSANRLVSFKPLTPATIETDVAVTGLQGGEQIIGMDFHPTTGVLYAVTSANRIYVLDPATGVLSGAITLTANPLDATDPFTALSGTEFGVDFNSVDGVLRVQSNTGQNLRVTLDDGTVITDGAFIAGTQIVGTAFSRPYAGALTSLHHALDVGTGTLVRQTSIAGTLQTIGPFNTGLTYALEGGFDIAGGENGLAVAALLPIVGTQSMLYRVNLGNGALIPLGYIGPAGTVIQGLSVRVQ